MSLLWKISKRIARLAAALSLFAAPSSTQGVSSYKNFEASFVNPIRLSLDGNTLFVLNNPRSSLTVFDISSPTNPVMKAEIPVGLEPVSVNVNPANSDEVWVVNQESDSISVVSVSKQLVTDTIAAKDEPADVVFADTYAFVSIARSNLINVYSAATHALVSSIPVFGALPRAMAVSPDGSTVYAAFAMSGNQSTSIPSQAALAEQPQGPPNLLPIPAQAYITTFNNPLFAKTVTYTMPDNDVVAIDVASLTIKQYFNSIGTVLFGLAVQPATGNLFVTNTDATNTVRYQPTLCGKFVLNRISQVTLANTTVAYPLDPVSPVNCGVDTNALSLSLAQPANVVFDGTGNNMYIAAFGSDRIAKVDVNGNILARIDINPEETGSTAAPATKRGPRGLAINNNTNKLYVLNRISNTFSIIDTLTDSVSHYDFKTGSKDPTPATVRQGRGFLYDAKLSGNGSSSCASCHVDGETDHLAWDLGDPTGTFQPLTLQGGQVVQLNPIKGPMTTTTLRGLQNTAPYHWRGDKASLSDFNAAFPGLMGGNQLSASDMQTFATFLNTIVYMPNPNQNLDRSLPTALNGGNAQNGLSVFQTFPANKQNQTCVSCHALVNNTIGSNLSVQQQQTVQPLKIPQLRAGYQKQLFTAPGATIDGFGLGNSGIIAGVFAFLNRPTVFSKLAAQPQKVLDVAAYMLSFDTGMAPAVGYTRTLLASNVTSVPVQTDWATLESQALLGNCQLIAQGTVQGKLVNLSYSPATNSYVSQSGLTILTHQQLINAVQRGDTLTIMGTPPL